MKNNIFSFASLVTLTLAALIATPTLPMAVDNSAPESAATKTPVQKGELYTDSWFTHYFHETLSGELGYFFCKNLGCLQTYTIDKNTVYIENYLEKTRPANLIERMHYNAVLRRERGALIPVGCDPSSYKHSFTKQRLEKQIDPSGMIERIHYASLCAKDTAHKSWALREMAKCSLLGLAYLMPGPIQ